MGKNKENNYLVSTSDYMMSGIHIGVQGGGKFLKDFIYKTNHKGVRIFDIEQINKSIVVAVNMLSRYDANNIVVVCKRENGWEPATLFSKKTGIRVFTYNYKPGMLTNMNIESFIEPKIMLVIDGFADSSAIKDASLMGIPVIALVDTNNKIDCVDLIIPCNNKGRRSLGMIFYLLAREFLRLKGFVQESSELDVNDFIPVGFDDFKKI